MSKIGVLQGTNGISNNGIPDTLSVKQWDGWGNSTFIWVCVKKIFEHDNWVNYNDLTTTSLESWLIRGIIPKWP